ncbi:MAG TPA: DsbA family protein [Gemmataceae bacterium]|nr:DsbA family protein [Gemmataceae bacterium]
MRVGPTLDALLEQYPKDVRLVYKMHPLPMHANAMIAAQAALAAQAQGKFLEMHHKLYESSAALSRDKILEIAAGLGLNMKRFTKDMDSEEVKNRIDRETREAMDIGAGGTPAAFVNGRYVSGAKPLEYYKSLVDEELKWAKDKNRPAFTVGKNVSEALPAQVARTGPEPNKVYDLPVGKAPVIGAKNARVTILHYMDYQ